MKLSNIKLNKQQVINTRKKYLYLYQSVSDGLITEKKALSLLKQYILQETRRKDMFEGNYVLINDCSK